MRTDNPKIALRSNWTHLTLLLVVPIICMFPSCSSNNTPYSKFYDIGESGWRRGELLDFDVSQIDSAAIVKNIESPCAVVLTIRHTDNYPYQNLWLIAENIIGGSKINVDTLQCVLTDKAGVKVGRGNKGLYEWSDTITILPKFPYDYKVSIGEVMQDSVINGIVNVGVSVIRL